MFISLFFLSITITMHGICLWRAHKALPMGPFFFEKKADFKGSSQDFEQLLENWILKNPKLLWHNKETLSFVVEEKTSFFSYGFFYCFSLERKNDAWQVHIGVQAKLIPMAVEHRHQESNPLSSMEPSQDAS